MEIPYKRESHRREKVEVLVQQEISRILLHELSDPRCGFCTVTRVGISADLQNANVYVSVLGDEGRQRTALRGLQHAKGYVQRLLFKNLRLKRPLDVSFHIDHSIERSIRISRILSEEDVPEDQEEEEQEGDFPRTTSQGDDNPVEDRPE